MLGLVRRFLSLLAPDPSPDEAPSPATTDDEARIEAVAPGTLPTIGWLPPWIELARADDRRFFEDELYREIGPHHVLANRLAIAVGRVDGADDVLYMLDGGDVAEVHLTFAATRESEPAWPRAVVFPGVEAWIEARMIPSHRRWSGRP